MTLTHDQYNILLGFLSALASGAVAGLVAGWVLMRHQLDREWAAKDASRILDIFRSLEEAELSLARGVSREKREAKSNPPDFKPILDEAREALLKIAFHAQYLRSAKYRFLRAYLVLRIKKARLWEISDYTKLLRLIRELAQDMTAYATKHDVFDRIALWYASRFPDHEKTILTNATFHDEPVPWMTLVRGIDWNSHFRRDMCLLAIKALVKGGLLSEQADKYLLTRKGWRIAIKVSDGKFDSTVGLMIEH